MEKVKHILQQKYLRIEEFELLCLWIFPVTVRDVIHDAVHAGVHRLVQCRILFHAIPPSVASYLTSETGD